MNEHIVKSVYIKTESLDSEIAKQMNEQIERMASEGWEPVSIAVSSKAGVFGSSDNSFILYSRPTIAGS